MSSRSHVRFLSLSLKAALLPRQLARVEGLSERLRDERGLYSEQPVRHGRSKGAETPPRPLYIYADVSQSPPKDTGKSPLISARQPMFAEDGDESFARELFVSHEVLSFQ